MRYEWVSLGQAASLTGVPVRRLRTLALRGKVPVSWPTGRQIRFSYPWLLAYLDFRYADRRACLLAAAHRPPAPVLPSLALTEGPPWAPLCPADTAKMLVIWRRTPRRSMVLG